MCDINTFPRPPKLGGGIWPNEWLRQSAKIDRKTRANFRAKEADEVADWLDKVARWFNAARQSENAARGWKAHQSERTGA